MTNVCRRWFNENKFSMYKRASTSCTKSTTFMSHIIIIYSLVVLTYKENYQKKKSRSKLIRLSYKYFFFFFLLIKNISKTVNKKITSLTFYLYIFFFLLFTRFFSFLYLIYKKVGYVYNLI